MKKFISVVVSICMILSCLPILSFAEVQYPQEVTVFDSAVSGFNALSNEYGIFSISGSGHIKNEDGSLTLGTDEGVQFTPNERFCSVFKSGALLEINVDFIINATENDKTAIFAMRNSNDNMLNMFEYYKSAPKVRAFSWNQRETTLDKETLSGAEFSVNLKLNTKNGNGDASFTYKQKDSTEAKQVTYKTLDLNAATANVSGNGIKFNTLWANSPKLLRFYLSKNDTLKSVKINLTDLSTDSLYASINTAANAEEVKEVLDYYSKNSSFSYGDRFDELSDSEKTVIYGRFINQNFTSDSEVQALFDRLVAKQFSIVTKTYTYDFEDGVNPFSQGSIQTLSDGNNVYVPLNSGANQLRPANLANTANGPVVTEYDYCYNGDGTSGYGIAFRYLAGNSAYYLNQFTRFANFVLYGQKAVTPQHLGYKAFYRIRQSLDVDTLGATLSAKEKSADGDYTQFTFDESTIYTPYNTSTGNPFTESIGKIAGIDFRTERTDDYVDNVTVKVYNPVYTALSYTETADEVKNVFDIYSSLGSIDTVYDSEYEVNYNKVYEAFIGSSNYSSTKALQDAFNAECENNLIYPDYETELGAYSGDEKVSYFDKGNSFNAKASIISRVDGDAGAVLVCAQYSNDGTLIDVWTDTKPLTNGVKADLSVTPDITTVTDTYMKLMLLNSLDNLKPYCKSEYVRASEADKKTTVYLVGDSLCADYDTRSFAEGGRLYPYQGWGYYLAESFNNVTVVNHAVPGWTTDHYVNPDSCPEDWNVDSSNPNVWANFKNDIQPGDYVIIGLGINDSGNNKTGEVRVTEERFKENLNVMYTDATNAGATVIFATPTISGGDEGTATGWKYSLSNLWAARGEVTREFAESKGAVCLQLGKTLSETYEAMYQQYKTDNPSAADIEARDYVRHWFHLYISTVKSEWGLTDDQINLHNGSIKGGKDDSTHMNMRGAKRCAEIIAGLIRDSGSSLGDRYKK